MKRKPLKVEEPGAAYEVGRAVDKGVALAGAKDIKKINARLVRVHRKVLQKLAQ